MSLAAHLADKGFEVEVYEKNESPGGKVRLYINDGFTFDLGATVYFFPEIFDRFFNKFNHSASDFYTLKKLNPTYRIFIGSKNYFDIPVNKQELLQLSESFEKGGADEMKRYLNHAENSYNYFRDEILTNPVLDYKKHVKRSWLHAFISRKKHQKYVRNHFKSYQLNALLLFPLPFLGAVPDFSPDHTMIANYALLTNGIFYPEGGMHRVEEALSAVLREMKVPVHLSSEVKSFDIIGESVSGILTHQKNFHADLFASAMDYHHTEQLLGKGYRNYHNAVWKSRSIIPSVLIFYIGFGKKLRNLLHYNLIISDGFDFVPKESVKIKSDHSTCLILLTCSSKSDPDKAPEGMDNLIARITIPPGLEDTGKMREHYFTILMDRLEKITGQRLRKEMVVKKSFALNDFEKDYYSYRGQILGALNSIRASMFWSPRVRNKHLSNLYYAELPNILGPGMASSLLTGEMIAQCMTQDYYKKNK